MGYYDPQLAPHDEVVLNATRTEPMTLTAIARAVARRSQDVGESLMRLGAHGLVSVVDWGFDYSTGRTTRDGATWQRDVTATLDLPALYASGRAYSA